jgi:hypothetical protein
LGNSLRSKILSFRGPNKNPVQISHRSSAFLPSFPRPILDCVPLLDFSHVFQRYRLFRALHSRIYSPRSIAIREYDAKLLLAYWLERAPPVDSSAKLATNFSFPSPKVAQVSWDPETNSITPDTKLPGWVFSSKLVAKPDQLIKRRGKAGLLALNKTWDEAKEWIAARAGKPQKASTIFCVLHVLCPSVPWIWLGQRPRLYFGAALSASSLMCHSWALICKDG